MAVLTIFWTALADADRAVLEEASRAHEAHVVRANPELLVRQALAAVARGPVICVVGTDREAGHALGLGIDEVLRAGEVTTGAMAEAVGRARARAAVRASREYRHALLDEDDETALAVLGGALGERLEMPLAMASLDCASVADAMNCLIELDDQFFAWTALVAPSEQLRSLIARRLTAPPAPELKGVLRRLRASIGRAESLVRLLRELTDPKGSRGPLFVATLLADIVDVMRPVIEPSVEISVEAAPECVTTASRTTIVVVVGALLSNALDGIRASSRGKGKISLQAFEAEDAIVVEVRDDGREIPTDLRPDLLERQFGAGTSRRGLPGLRDRVRRAGGDMLVDSGSNGNTIRVFLPSGRVHDGAALAAETLGTASPSTRKSGN